MHDDDDNLSETHLQEVVQDGFDEPTKSAIVGIDGAVLRAPEGITRGAVSKEGAMMIFIRAAMRSQISSTIIVSWPMAM